MRGLVGSIAQLPSPSPARIDFGALTTSHTLGGIIVALIQLNSMLQIIKNKKKIKSEHFNIKIILLTQLKITGRTN